MKNADLKTWVEVDTRALTQNVAALVRGLAKDVAVIAVVKSNAYGHGLELCARTLAILPGVSMLAVDSIDEALQLKKAGIKKPVLILGYIPRVMLKEAVRCGFQVCLYDKCVLKDLAVHARALRKKAYVHIKIETGTSRQGVVSKDWGAFARALAAAPSIFAEGIYTHFADTEDLASSFYKTQLAEFTHAREIFAQCGVRPRMVHASSTAASMAYPDAHCNAVRLGIGVYGMYPSQDIKKRSRVLLQPIATWKTRVAQVKQIPKGATVSYDRTFTAHKPMTIAVLPVGYWDGFDRGFSNNAAVLIAGMRCPIIGRICMNMCVADIHGIRARVMAGDEVVLLGKQGRQHIPAEELAKRIGTINYEITARINPLIARLGV